MKRSEVNKILKETIGFVESLNFKLPPFAYWTVEDWKEKGEEVDEIRDNMLGWDVTDYGLGDFNKQGLTLFTVRNGNINDKRYPKPYCEKILIVREGQVCTMHYHWNKTEDIINRGGGNMMIELWNAGENNTLADTDVNVSIDGCKMCVKAGTILCLEPGQSITLTPYLYHSFWPEEGKGTLLLGEVSTVNDDVNDNCFYEPQGRFPTIEEDEKPMVLLCNEYKKFA